MNHKLPVKEVDKVPSGHYAIPSGIADVVEVVLFEELHSHDGKNEYDHE